MMIETIGIVAICLGVVALVTSGVTLLSVVTSSTVSSPENRNQIDEAEYQKRLKSHYNSVYMCSGCGSYPRGMRTSTSSI